MMGRLPRKIIKTVMWAGIHHSLPQFPIFKTISEVSRHEGRLQAQTGCFSATIKWELSLSC